MRHHKKKKAPEIAANMVGKRQVAAGILRQALIDAERDWSGSTPLGKCSDKQVREEIKLIIAALGVLVKSRVPAKWVAQDDRENSARNADLKRQEYLEQMAVNCQHNLPAVAPPLQNVCDAMEGRSAGMGEGAKTGASESPTLHVIEGGAYG